MQCAYGNVGKKIGSCLAFRADSSRPDFERAWSDPLSESSSGGPEPEGQQEIEEEGGEGGRRANRRERLHLPHDGSIRRLALVGC